MAWTQEKINEIYTEVQRTAMTDEEFRKELLQEPSADIEKIAGEKLSKDFKVNVVESDPAYSATFVLPPLVSEELDEDDLDMVAGGVCLADGCAADACGGDISI